MKRVITVILSILISISCIPYTAFASVTYEGECPIDANVYKIPNEAGTYTYKFTPEEDGIYGIYQEGRLLNSLTYKMYEFKNGTYTQIKASGQNAGGEYDWMKVYKTADCNFFMYKAGVPYKLVVTSEGDNQLTGFQIRRLYGRYSIPVIVTGDGYIARDLSLDSDYDCPIDIERSRTEFQKAFSLPVVGWAESIVVKAMGGSRFVGFFNSETGVEISSYKRDDQTYAPDELYSLSCNPDEIGDIDFIEARFKKIGEEENPNIELKMQQITGTSTYSKSVGDSPFTLDAKTTGNGELTYLSDNASVATVNSSGRVTIVGKGTAPITVTAAKTEQYMEATKQITINVTDRKAQILTGTTRYDKKVGDSDFKLNIKSSGDGILSYVSDNQSVASVSSSGMVSIKASGTAKITVKASQTNNYDASEIIVVVNVQKKAETIDMVSNFEIMLNKNNKSISYNWDEVKDAEGYNLLYSYDGTTWRTCFKTLMSAGNADISGLKKGSTIYVKVQAYKTVDGNTIYSQDSEVLTVRRVSTPTLKLSKVNRSKVKLSWKSTKSADGYEVYRKTNSGKYLRVCNTKNTSYINKNLKRKKTYYYYLKPYQMNDEGVKVYGSRTNIKKIKM
ncbi:Bacterial Ig-like domain (group 2) [uncultured Eubacterium sp.]|nr:Bacterial Ig-like domain (group 2) [uncultured Eubacterium sp.]